jgi:hypothetical protein
MNIIDETIVVITGLINELFVDNLIKSYKNTNNKLISTWYDQDKDLIELLRINNFKIVLNFYPKHINSTNVQIYSAHRGTQEAKKLGYKYVCHTRTDVFPLNYIEFLTRCQELYTQKLMIISGIPTHVLFLQILTAGPINEILKFYNKLQEPHDTRFPEIYLMETYLGKKDLTKEDIKTHFNICLNLCRKYDIEFIWVRPPWWGIGCRTIPMMKVINEYCKESDVYE